MSASDLFAVVLLVLVFGGIIAMMIWALLIN